MQQIVQTQISICFSALYLILFLFIGQHSLKQAKSENDQWAAQSTNSVDLGNSELISRHKRPEPSISPGLALVSFSQTTCTNSSPPVARMTPYSQTNVERGRTSGSRVKHKPYSDVRHKADSDPNASSSGKKTIRIVVHDDDDVADESNMDTEMNGIQADKTQHVVNSNNSDSFSMVPSETDSGETGTCVANSEVNLESHIKNTSLCTNKAQNIDISGLDMSVTNENTHESGSLDSMNIKVETNTEYDSNLEISGVELANSECGKLVITKTRPCNKQRFFLALKIEKFQLKKIDIFSSPARSAQSYCCHLGRPRLCVRPRHTFS